MADIVSQENSPQTPQGDIVSQENPNPYQDIPADSQVMSDRQAAVATALSQSNGTTSIPDLQQTYEAHRNDPNALKQTLQADQVEHSKLLVETQLNPDPSAILPPDVSAHVLQQEAANRASMTPTQRLMANYADGSTPLPNKQQSNDGYTLSHAQKVVEDARNNIAAQQGTMGDLWDVTEAVLGYGAEPFKIRNAVEDITGNKNLPSVFGMGTAKKYLHDSFMYATPQRRKEMTTKFVHWMKNNSGIVGDTNLMMITSLMGDALGMDVSKSGERMDNIFGWLDIAGPILTSARGITKAKNLMTKIDTNVLNRYGRSSVVDSIDEANPEAGTTAKEQVINSGQGSAELGTNPTQVATDMIPMNAKGDPMPRGRATLVRKIRGNEYKAEEELLLHGLYTSKERAMAQNRILTQLSEGSDKNFAITHFNLVDESGKAVSGKGQLEATKAGIPVADTLDSVRFQARYGAPSSASGFRTPLAAYNQAKLMGIPDEAIQLTHREAGTGNEYRVLDNEMNSSSQVRIENIDGDPQMMSNPDIYLNVDWHYYYNKNDLLAFDEHPITRGYGLTRHAVSAAWKVRSDIRDAIQITHDQEKRVREIIASHIPHELSKLSYDEQTTLGRILHENAGNSATPGARLSNDELKTKYGASGKLTQAYNGVRDLYHQVFVLRNHARRASMMEDGVRAVFTDGVDGFAALKPLKEEEYASPSALFSHLHSDAKGTLWDMGADKPVYIGSQKDLENYLDHGYRIARSRSPYGFRATKDEAYTHVLLDPRKTKVRDLPTVVLRENPGYIPRIYKNTYFVRKVGTTTVNGTKVPVTTTVHAASSHKEATAIAASLDKEAGVAGLHQVDLAKEIDEEMMGYQGAYRNKEILEQHDALQGAVLEDPIKAMYRSISAASKSMTYEKTIGVLEERFRKTFEKQLTDPTNPYSELKDFPEKARAEEFQHVLRLYKGSTDTVDHILQNGAVVAAEKLEKIGLDRLAGYMRKGREVSVSSRLRAGTFTTLLGLNPLRQLLMQSSQFSLIAGMEPTLSLKAMPLGVSLIAGSAIKATNTAKYADFIKTASKGLGLSSEDLKTMIKNFEQSGMSSSIDANMFMTEGLMDITHSLASSKTGFYTKRANELGKKLLKIPQKFGFNAGEYSNLAMTYAFSSLRRMRDHGSTALLDRTHIQQIAADTKMLALSPNRVGAFTWQSNMLSFATQFLAFQAKTLELLTHGVAEGKITKAERNKILATQALLWGTTGIGLDSAYQEIRDHLFDSPVPEGLDVALRGGLMDYTLYAILNAHASPDDATTKLAVSKSFSPLPNIGDMVAGLDNMVQYGYDPGLTSTLLGPSGHMINSIAGTMGTLVTLFTQMPDLTTNEKMTLALQQASEVVPFLSNSTKSILGWGSGQALSTRDYSATVHATKDELLARALFGFSTYGQQDYWNTYMENVRTGKYLQQVGTDLGKYFNGLLASEPGNAADISSQRLYDLLTKVQNTVALMNLSDDQRQQVMKSFKRSALTLSNPGYQNMLQSMVRTLVNADSSNTPTAIRNHALNNRGLTPDDRKQLEALVPKENK